MSGIQPKPYVREEKAGCIAWCACGESMDQPYCDGSHGRKNTGKKPVIVVLEKDQRVAWCGCRRSKAGAFCDGSHKIS
ncbi:MAG: CDGSH iron-sulfur domain-containing protein [Candidatus Omnitrophota bacterium]